MAVTTEVRHLPRCGGGDRQLALDLSEWNAVVSAAFQQRLRHGDRHQHAGWAVALDH
jgi:hypothetical protein